MVHRRKPFDITLSALSDAGALSTLRRGFEPYWRGLLHMLDDGGTLLAGHIAFAGMFALFPFIIFLTTLAGEVGQSAAAQNFVELSLEALPGQVRAAIEPAVSEVLTGGRQGLMTLSIIASLWAVSSAFEAARYALNLAYQVKQTRAIWWQRLQSLMMVLLFAIGIILIMVTTVAAPIVWTLIDLFDFGSIQWRPRYGTIRLFLSAILLLALIMPLYIWLPNRRLRALDVLPGAMLAVTMWIVGASAYSWYLLNLGRFSVTYGSLGGVVATLLFFYISALIFIFGAEVNAARLRMREQGPEAPTS
ncbi:MAG: YihY/virulence factor BrkB family protein [Pseudomonadota bacterium]